MSCCARLVADAGRGGCITLVFRIDERVNAWIRGGGTPEAVRIAWQCCVIDCDVLEVRTCAGGAAAGGSCALGAASEGYPREPSDVSWEGECV